MTAEHQTDGAVSDAEDAVQKSDSHFQGVKTRPHNSSKDRARETGRELFLYCYSLEMHLRDGVDVEGVTAERTDRGIQTRSRNRTNNLLRKTGKEPITFSPTQ